MWSNACPGPPGQLPFRVPGSGTRAPASGPCPACFPEAADSRYCALSLPGHVLLALDNNATWHDIATALATGPEQAELRYSPDSPVADSDHRTRCRSARPPKSCDLTDVKVKENDD